MRPIEELTGLTIDAITVEELEAEIAERHGIKEIAETDRHPMSGPLAMKMSVETNRLAREVCRIKLLPPIPKWPPYEALIGPGNLEAFQAGIEYGKKLVKYEAANKGHNKSRPSRVFAIKEAIRLFKSEPVPRMGEVTELIDKACVKASMPCNSAAQVRKWLVEAEKNGLINIPPEARKSGPSKKK